MDNSERVSLGAAVAAHAALFVALSYGLTPRTPEPRREAVAVTLTDNVGEIATATDRPAAAASQSTPSPLESMLPPLPMQPSVEPRPQPRATPAPARRPMPRSR
ncbi:MAG: cell envelope biogenesis protein TolA, partial [Sphingomonadaceae bacterium]|nr:cell envelope biogenesis protein TolA [Sphingomonadaceae bacterium]